MSICCSNLGDGSAAYLNVLVDVKMPSVWLPLELQSKMETKDDSLLKTLNVVIKKWKKGLKLILEIHGIESSEDGILLGISAFI